MDPNNREPEGSAQAGSRLDRRSDQGAGPHRPPRDPLAPELGGLSSAPVRTVELVCGDYLLTVNPVDGSEIVPCPPGDRPAPPERVGAEERAELRRAALPPVPAGPAGLELPVLERGEDCQRLVRLLARGRSVRVTGPAGSGRSTLLDAVAADCAELAPDGVVRLSGHRRTPADLLYELFATVHHAPLHRPDRAGLLALVREIGAVVVLDDIEFGGSALDDILDATPECAFLISATPDVPAPSSGSHLEEVFLTGLSRAGCLDLLERAVQRPLTEDESAWAADLWFESEGLPLRFVQAGGLLRQRDALRIDPEVFDEYGVFAEKPCDALVDSGDPHDVPLPTLAEAAAPAPLLASRLSGAARDTLRFAVALGGEIPHQAHLPALAGDTHADAALGEILGCGLATPVGGHYRLAAGILAQLEAAAYGGDAAARAHTAAQHYAWWAGHPSVTPQRVTAEADEILAAMAVLVGSREPAHPSAAVLLARTAAPAFAAGLHWWAWERALRHGQEAARLAGEVAEEAYFHHELGILALCNGSPDRARAELEASIGLRGVLADRRGAVAGRRALALVADRAGDFAHHGPGRTAAGEEAPDVRTVDPASPPGGLPAGLALSSPASDAAVTVIARLGGGDGGDGARGGTGGAKLRGAGWLVLSGARRNVVAAGTGALLAIVLGTVVTLGVTSGDGEEGAADQVTSEQTPSEEDGGDGLADEPRQDSTSSPKPSPSAPPTPPGQPAPVAVRPSDSGQPVSQAPASPPAATKAPSTPRSPSTTTPPPSLPSSAPSSGSVTSPSPSGSPEPTDSGSTTTASGPTSSSSADSPADGASVL